MPEFSFSKSFNFPINQVFDWHKSDLALERITPPWDNIKVVKREPLTTNFLKDGKIILEQNFMPLVNLKWRLSHQNYVEGKSFEDKMISGPVKSWVHNHEFIQESKNKTKIRDKINFSHWIKIKKLDGFTLNSMEKSFRYRNKIIEHDLSKQYANTNGYYVVVSGASGLVGSDLVPLLNSLGYKILILKFDENSTNLETIQVKSIKNKEIVSLNWNPYSKVIPRIPKEIAEKVKFLVNLSGENILGVWTKSKKDLIVKSRLHTTRSLLSFIKTNSIELKTSIHASATGYYGSNKDMKLDENNSPGIGFLAKTTNEWEKEQNNFLSCSKRNINLRIGTVLSSKGGLIKLIKAPFRLGLAGYVGNGNNYINWILLEDLIRIIERSFHDKAFSGPVNAVSPTPLKSKDFFRVIAEKYNSKIFISIPAFFPNLISKELVQEIILSNQKIIPKKLLRNEYKFFAHTLDKALDNIVGI
tara:strand:- start:13119 stop:14534 length:1416 start_codon:yes stop_codon:yes gene_type:complete